MQSEVNKLIKIKKVKLTIKLISSTSVTKYWARLEKYSILCLASDHTGLFLRSKLLLHKWPKPAQLNILSLGVTTISMNGPVCFVVTDVTF